MDIKHISITDFTYSLPDEKIAVRPLKERDQSRLLIYKDNTISENIYRNISQYIPENSLLVFNDTKVVEARIIFQKATGGQIELFCLEPSEAYGDISSAMLQKQKVWWKCLVGGASKWKKGQPLEKKITTTSGDLLLKANFIEKKSDYFIIEFEWAPADYSFAEILHLAGIIPLPPYIKRKADAHDDERYQTVYAVHDGSVAAPTAGLHFNETIFESLKAKKIQSAFVTLHVGAGTFKPVKSETLEEHIMHEEFIEVNSALIQKMISALPSTIIPVGTTSLRTLETLYWLGVKTILNPNISSELLTLHQWEVYEIQSGGISTVQSLQSLLQWMAKHQLTKLVTKTQLLIVPGYQFKIADALITNFHQPQSTLLLLVAALTGDDWKKIYQHALDNEFRFLSYGDGCLLFAKKL